MPNPEGKFTPESAHSDLNKEQLRTEESWDNRFSRDKGWREGTEPVPYLMSYIENHPDEIPNDAAILDLGCGNGRNLVPLAEKEEKEYRLTGIDISGEGLNRTRERLDEKNLKAELKKGACTDLSEISDESQDLVFSMGVIHHNRWEGIQQSFAEVKRVLKPGKSFVFSGRSINDTDTPREQIEDHGFTARDTEGNKEGVIQHYFTEEELRELAEENKFEIVKEPEELTWPRDEYKDRVQARWQVVYRKKEN